jgi:hypothetical protein
MSSYTIVSAKELTIQIQDSIKFIPGDPVIVTLGDTVKFENRTGMLIILSTHNRTGATIDSKPITNGTDYPYVIKDEESYSIANKGLLLLAAAIVPDTLYYSLLIPTTTPLGVIILIALIIVAGVYLLMRRKPVTA